MIPVKAVISLPVRDRQFSTTNFKDCEVAVFVVLLWIFMTTVIAHLHVRVQHPNQLAMEAQCNSPRGAL